MEWEYIVGELFEMILIPVIPLVTAYICLYIKRATDRLQLQTDNEYADKYLAIAEDAMIRVVVTVSETYVKALKEDGSFDLAAQKEALEMAAKMFDTIISEECRSVLNEMYGDYEAWIRSQIESVLPTIKPE